MTQIECAVGSYGSCASELEASKGVSLTACQTWKACIFESSKHMSAHKVHVIYVLCAVVWELRLRAALDGC